MTLLDTEDEEKTDKNMGSMCSKDDALPDEQPIIGIKTENSQGTNENVAENNIDAEAAALAKRQDEERKRAEAERLKKEKELAEKKRVEEENTKT